MTPDLIQIAKEVGGIRRLIMGLRHETFFTDEQLEAFVTRVRNAALEEAAKAAVNAVASNGGIVRMDVHVHQAIRNLKEPTP